MPELKRKLSELLAYMDQTRSALLATAGDINPSFASVRPRSGDWSASEVVAHLAMVEDGVGRLITKAVRKAREDGIGPDMSDGSILSSLDRYHLVDNAAKLKAPPIITPEGVQSVEQSLAALEQSRARLRETLIGATDVDLSGVRRPHPVLGDIDLYQWALFVAQHEERHRRQIERTINEVTGLAAECAPIV